MGAGPVRAIGWIVVYDAPEGLEVYTSRDTAWEELPGDGLLDGCVYRERDDGTVDRRTVGGSDHYWLLPDGLSIAHSNAPKEEIRRRYPGAVVKRGRWVPDGLMAEAAKLTLEVPWP